MIKLLNFVLASVFFVASCRAAVADVAPKNERSGTHRAQRDATAHLKGAGAHETSADGAEIDKRDEIGCSPLCKALTERNMERVEFLLAAGADANGEIDGGMHRPLTFAILHRLPAEFLKALILHGADVNLGGRLGRPVDFAARLNNPIAFNLLFRHGAKLTWANQDELESDLLVSALMGDNVETFKQLLSERYCNGFDYVALLLWGDDIVGANGMVSIPQFEFPQIPSGENDPTEALVGEMRSAMGQASVACAGSPSDGRAQRRVSEIVRGRQGGQD